MRDVVGFWLAYADSILFMTRAGDKRRAEEMKSATDRMRRQKIYRRSAERRVSDRQI